MKEIYSINLCFGKQDHLNIRGPILIPYLEQEEELSSQSYVPKDSSYDNKNEESSNILFLS